MIDKIYRERFKNGAKRVIMWKILINDFFQKFVDSNDTVLDVPCGYGEFINNISCKKKIAVDTNADCRLHLDKGIRFYQCSADSLPLASGSVNKIFVSNFFEHIDRDLIAKVIAEFRRVLVDGGRVMVLQPNIRFCAKDYWMFFDHITEIDDRALEEVFGVSGFKIVKRIERFLPYTTQSRLPQADWMIRLYLRLPILWRIMGKQSFLVFKKLEVKS